MVVRVLQRRFTDKEIEFEDAVRTRVLDDAIELLDRFGLVVARLPTPEYRIVYESPGLTAL